MKKILFIISRMEGGGAQRVMANLANELCGKYEITLLTLEGRTLAYRLDPSVKICRYESGTDWLSVRFEKNIPLIGRIFWVSKMKKKICPDVSVSFLPVPNLVNVLSRGRKKVIVSERADPFVSGDPRMAVDNFTFRLADHIVFQSEQVRGYFSSGIRKKSSIILNPVDVPRAPSGNRENRIVNVCRLAPQKNQKLLIDAFYEFHKRHPEYGLDIYGKGPLEGDLRARITQLNLEKNVILHGFAPDVFDRIGSAKMFVLSSDYEGLSNALLEAMMMGIPCISTRVAGSKEVISDMENGLLVDIGDRAGLTDAMLRLAEDDMLREKIRKNAMISSEMFRPEKIIPQWEALF